jgi:hypothetical protein
MILSENRSHFSGSCFLKLSRPHQAERGDGQDSDHRRGDPMFRGPLVHCHDWLATNIAFVTRFRRAHAHVNLENWRERPAPNPQSSA